MSANPRRFFDCNHLSVMTSLVINRRFLAEMLTPCLLMTDKWGPPSQEVKSFQAGWRFRAAPRGLASGPGPSTTCQKSTLAPFEGCWPMSSPSYTGPGWRLRREFSLLFFSFFPLCVSSRGLCPVPTGLFPRSSQVNARPCPPF